MFWINADILKIGTADGNPIEPRDFEQRVNALDHAIPSVGWITSKEATGYTSQDVSSMLEKVRDVRQPVTFSLRAGMAAQSKPEMESLTKNPKTALVLHMKNSEDKIDVGKIKELVKSIGKNRVFLDLPDVHLQWQINSALLLNGRYYLIIFMCIGLFRYLQ